MFAKNGTRGVSSRRRNAKFCEPEGPRDLTCRLRQVVARSSTADGLAWPAQGDRRAALTRDRVRAEKASELAPRHPLANVGRVRRTVEEVGVDIERDARPRVPEDPADLGDVKPKVDDQMAGEGVA